jgi:hypothetical protein
MNGSQGTSAGAADRLFGAMKQNPEALLLLAAGCALLMRSTPASATRERSGGASEGVARAAEGMRQYTTDAVDQARETIGSYASSASSYAGQATRAVGDQSQQMFEQTQSAVQSTFDRVLRDQPLMLAFAGLAAGAAIAASFAPTGIEKDTLGPVGERVAQAAADVGERLKDAASEATGTLKQSAERRGMTAEALKEMASEVTGAFSNRMTESSQPRGVNDGSQASGAAGGESRKSPLG